MDVPVPQIMEEIVEIIARLQRSYRRQATARVDVHVEQIVDVPVPRILEQNVDVIMVILQEQCVFSFDSPSHTRVLAYFESVVWEGSCGRHVPHVLPLSPLPHARVGSECKRWNLEQVVLDLFSHIQTGKIQWLFVCCRGSRSPNSPFALSRLANLTHAVAARLRLRVPTWQHVYRRVLHELDIEFEPTRHWTRQFLPPCAA